MCNEKGWGESEGKLYLQHASLCCLCLLACMLASCRPGGEGRPARPAEVVELSTHDQRPLSTRPGPSCPLMIMSVCTQVLQERILVENFLRALRARPKLSTRPHRLSTPGLAVHRPPPYLSTHENEHLDTCSAGRPGRACTLSH